jgi:hypothetical protein
VFAFFMVFMVRPHQLSNPVRDLHDASMFDGMFSTSVNAHSIMCTRSQSGQIQVGPLLMPHLFSSKQSGQI